MALSIFLAKLFGLYLIVISIILLSRPKQLVGSIKALAESNELIFFGSIINIIIGLALIIGHNVWVADWRVIITILAWLLFIRGIVNIYYPSFAKKMVTIFEYNPYFYTMLGIYIVIGIYLTYVGYTA